MNEPELYIQASRKRRALIFFAWFAVGAVIVNFFRERSLGDLIYTLAATGFGIAVACSIGTRRYFRLRGNLVEGPPLFGWRCVSMSTSTLKPGGIQRSSWDRLNGLLKIRGGNGTIGIGPLDFSREQRRQIQEAVELVVRQITDDGSGQ